jgi:hypothetical protein
LNAQRELQREPKGKDRSTKIDVRAKPFATSVKNSEYSQQWTALTASDTNKSAPGKPKV